MPLTCAAQDASVPAPDPPLYVDGSLCTKPDQIVFSCPLAKSGKIVSICAAGSAAPHRFYYAFGKPHAVEMTYPSNPEDLNNGFTHSFLMYAGGTGGYAYSFINKEIKYIVYSISGAGFDIGGVAVQKDGELRTMSDMKCVKGMIKEESDQALLDETLKWKVDDDVHGHGLPHVN